MPEPWRSASNGQEPDALSPGYGVRIPHYLLAAGRREEGEVVSSSGMVIPAQRFPLSTAAGLPSTSAPSSLIRRESAFRLVCGNLETPTCISKVLGHSLPRLSRGAPWPFCACDHLYPGRLQERAVAGTARDLGGWDVAESLPLDTPNLSGKGRGFLVKR